MQKTTIKLGEVILDALVKELPSHSAEITEKPVEVGSDIADHMRMTPAVVELTGTMVEDAASKLAILKGYQKDAELLTYIGRTIYNNMVIEAIDTDHAVETKEGYHYSIKLKQVRIAQPKTFKVTVKNPVTKKADKKTATKVKKKTNAGRQQMTPKRVNTQNVPKPNETQKQTIKRLTTPPSKYSGGRKEQTVHLN